MSICQICILQPTESYISELTSRNILIIVQSLKSFYHHFFAAFGNRELCVATGSAASGHCIDGTEYCHRSDTGAEWQGRCECIQYWGEYTPGARCKHVLVWKGCSQHCIESKFDSFFWNRFHLGLNPFEYNTYQTEKLMMNIFYCRDAPSSLMPFVVATDSPHNSYSTTIVTWIWRLDRRPTPHCISCAPIRRRRRKLMATRPRKWC